MKADVISAAMAYRIALQNVMRAQTLHQARQAAAKGLEVEHPKPEPGVVEVSSGFGYRTQQPFVTVLMATPIETANPTLQMSPAQARQIAGQLLEAAEAAESDGFLVGWLGVEKDLSEQQVGSLLISFRAYRDAQRKKEGDG